MIDFTKYQAAGNAYTILHKDGLTLSCEQASTMCQSVYGVGGDGVICWRSGSPDAVGITRRGHFQASIFNPDGSQAEKSGNGLRILATYLFNSVCPDLNKISIFTSGIEVKATLSDNETILLEMGQVVASSDLKFLGKRQEFYPGHELHTDIGNITGYPVSIGNPHFVVFSEKVTAENVQKWGPVIENHTFFSNRTNVQFAQVIDENHIAAEIWERGAGYTLSSGSSSCAIVAVAHKLELCGRSVTVSMPGGELTVQIRKDSIVLLTGPVNKTVEGVFKLV